MKTFLTTTAILTVLFAGAIAQVTIVEAEDATELTGGIKIRDKETHVQIESIKVQPDAENAGEHVFPTASYENISVAEAGTYLFYASTSGFQSGTRIILEIGGVEAGYVKTKNAGGWGNFLQTDTLEFDFPADTHTLKLTFSHDTYFDDNDETGNTGFLCNVDKFFYEKKSSGSVALNTLSSEELQVYPNPVSDKLTVKFGESARVSFLNLSGSVVKTVQVTSSEPLVDVSALARGVYLLKVETAKGTSTQSLVVK